MHNSFRRLLSLSLATTLSIPSTFLVAAPPTAPRLDSATVATTLGRDVNPAQQLNELQLKTYSEVLNFLGVLGYEDFSIPALQTALRPEMDSSQKETLLTNAQKHDIIPAAAELTAYLMANSRANLNQDDRTRTEWVKATVNVLMLGIKGLPNELPPELLNIANELEREVAIEKFLKRFIETSGVETLRELKTHLFSTLFSKEQMEDLVKNKSPEYIKHDTVITSLLKRIVKSMYSNLESTHSRFLGHAMTLALVREARLNKDKELERQLAEAFIARGEILGNYITSKIALPLREKNGISLKVVQMQTGDILSHYSRSQEGNFDGVRAAPRSWIKRAIEFVRLRLGLQVGRQLFDRDNQIQQKIAQRQKLSWTEKLITFVANLPILRRGYNMAGLVEVKRDTATGLERVQIYRNTTNSAGGGIQIEGLRSFATPGFVDRVAHFRLDGNKIAALNEGNLIGRNYSLSLDGSNGFKVGISQAAQQSIIQSMKTSEAALQTAGQYAVQMMKTMMAGTNVIGFNPIALPERRAYSSIDAVVLAYGAGAGIEIHGQNDYLYLGHGRRAEEFEAAKKIRFVSPTSLAWRTSLATATEMELPRMGAEARMLEFYTESQAVDTRMYALANNRSATVDFSEATLSQLTTRVKQTAEYDSLTEEVRNAKSDWKGVEGFTKELVSIPSDNLMTEQSMRDFLFALGLDDLTEDIEKYKKAGNTWNEITALQQDRNAKSYGMMNAGRELAILLMNRMQGRLAKLDGQKQMAELVGYLLSQQPINPIKKIPAEIATMPEEKQHQAHLEYMEKMLKQTMEEHTRTVVADLLNNIYGDNLDFTQDAEKMKEFNSTSKRLYMLVSQMIERMYMDHQTGQTRWAGRALAALMARQAELRKTEAQSNQLMAKAVASYGLRIENFLGDVLVYKNAAGQEVQIPVKTMDYVLTRNINPESATIPWGAQPHESLTKDAKKNGLVGNPLSGLLYLGEESVKDGYGTVDEIKDRAFYERLNKGFSHIGYAIVNGAPGSKVKMTLVVDNYPHPLADAGEGLPTGVKGNAGGVRYVGTEQFFMESTHSRFMIASIDPVLFHKTVMEQIAKTGIPKQGDKIFPFDLYKMKWDGNMVPTVEDPKTLERADFKVEVSNEVLQDLYTTKNPYTFHRKFTKLFDQSMREFIKKGMIFLWITPYGAYYIGGGYCSSTGPMATMRFGYNIESKPSRWIPLLKVLDKVITWGQSRGIKFFSSPDVTNIQKMARMPIMAPSSLAAQEYVTKHYDLEVPFTSIQKRVQADFVSQRAARSKEYARLVETSLPRGKYQQFAKDNLEYTEVAAYSHMVEKAETVRKGTIGFQSIRESLAWVRAQKDAKSQDLFRQLVNAAYSEAKVTVEPMTGLNEVRTQTQPVRRAGVIRCEGSYAN